MELTYDSRDERYHGIWQNGVKFAVDADVFAEVQTEMRKELNCTVEDAYYFMLKTEIWSEDMHGVETLKETYLTLSEAAQRAGVPKTTISHLIVDEVLSIDNQEGKLVIPQSSIDHWIQERDAGRLPPESLGLRKMTFCHRCGTQFESHTTQLCEKCTEIKQRSVDETDRFIHEQYVRIATMLTANGWNVDPRSDNSVVYYVHPEHDNSNAIIVGIAITE